MENEVRREVVSAGKHSMIYVVGQALSRVAGFFMIPIYTRFIVPKNYGAMELIDILVAAVGVLFAMGVENSMARFYYGERDIDRRNRVVSTVIVGLGLISLPFVCALIYFSDVFAAIVMPDSRYEYCFQLALTAVWFGVINEIGLSYLRMRYMARTFVVFTSIQLILALSFNIWFVAFLKLGILGIFWSTVISTSIVSMLMAFMILRRTGLSISGKVLCELIRFGLPLVPVRIGLMLGFLSNRFFLRWLGSSDPGIALAQVGIYSLGHKFAVVINRFVTVPFNAFWGPRRLELILEESPGAKEILARMCTYSTMCSTYIALVLASGIESLIEIMAEGSYRGAHVVVPYIALAYVILGLESHFLTGILYRKKTTYATYVSLLGICIVLVWNYLFVPKYGLIAAATSNIVGFTARIALIYTISQKLYRIPFEIGRIIKLLFVAFIMYGVSLSVNCDSAYLTFFARTGFASLLPVILYFCRFYRSGEVEFSIQFIRKVAAVGKGRSLKLEGDS